MIPKMTNDVLKTVLFDMDPGMYYSIIVDSHVVSKGEGQIAILNHTSYEQKGSIFIFKNEFQSVTIRDLKLNQMHDAILITGRKLGEQTSNQCSEIVVFIDTWGKTAPY